MQEYARQVPPQQMKMTTDKQMLLNLKKTKSKEKKIKIKTAKNVESRNWLLREQKAKLLEEIQALDRVKLLIEKETLKIQIQNDKLMPLIVQNFNSVNSAHQSQIKRQDSAFMDQSAFKQIFEQGKKPVSSKKQPSKKKEQPKRQEKKLMNVDFSQNFLTFAVKQNEKDEVEEHSLIDLSVDVLKQELEQTDKMMELLSDKREQEFLKPSKELKPPMKVEEFNTGESNEFTYFDQLNREEKVVRERVLDKEEDEFFEYVKEKSNEQFKQIYESKKLIPKETVQEED